MASSSFTIIASKKASGSGCGSAWRPYTDPAPTSAPLCMRLSSSSTSSSLKKKASSSSSSSKSGKNAKGNKKRSGLGRRASNSALKATTTTIKITISTTTGPRRQQRNAKALLYGRAAAQRPSVAAVTPAAAPTPISALKDLPRPAQREVCAAKIVLADASLAGVPPQYVRDHLEDSGPALLQGMAGIQVLRCSQTRLESEGTHVQAPTHVLALCSAPSPSPSSPCMAAIQSVIPVHALVLAAHCANMPSLPSTSSSISATSAVGLTTLPVVPLVLPSPSTFPILAGFLYHKNTHTLISQLLAPLPVPPTLEVSQVLEIPALGRVLAGQGKEVVVKMCERVWGLWMNARAVGVVEEEVWDAVEVAWEVCGVAMGLCGEARS
ncbi:hypothetical protein DFP72DRAFT_887923 [Ephemerocybe angulata]|uniref:Uncharacterized protein n=1 Tax=Ephemerocybe angulata TaxID=980116 RepID=A0A8H6I6B1_9AGAR|nr:hypothetical protein DFP72DRAFT_887923 [Tulosesus angulatus]